MEILIPLFPLLGWAAIGLAGGRWERRTVGWVACGSVAGAFGAALILLGALLVVPSESRHATVDVYRWIDAGKLQVPLRLLIDPLSVAMALVVSGVGALIHIYSIGYMDGDEGFARYFAYLNLFMASMLLLVLAGNLVVMFIGWEGVGLSSYLLIAFWFTRPEAARAGVKAFLVTRLGDVGFLLGIFLAFAVFGTTDIQAMTQNAPRISVGAATALALLLFLGAIGKSAQLPLYVWLPDAMEGPTPVSALIHAATMVTAGVYMIVRMHAVYLRAPVAMEVVAVVGAVTAIFAASCALVEHDIKRVLAYSTISQLGYMFLAVGIGAWSAGIFHLTSHAFFKALLFLAAGAVMHALGGETDMRRMGGLARRLPRTAAAFAVGALALSGIWPLSGFFSKDLILSDVFRTGHVWLWAVGVAASGLTAIYIGRVFVLTFIVQPDSGEASRGAGRAPATHARPSAADAPGPTAGAGLHDPPPVMARPMGALAALSVLGGALGWSFTRPGMLDRWLRSVVGSGVALAAPRVKTAPETALIAVSLAVALGGILLAWLIYGRRVIQLRVPALQTLLAHQFYVEDLYNAAAVAPARALARLAAAFDRTVIDGGVTGLARAVGGGGALLRKLQTGYLRDYAAFMLIGALLILAFWTYSLVR
jgi:NADH-quinone oxidoreductase subunit L